jgi:hypothetical protein
MAMTPDEYAARELNVPGREEGEALYAPGFNPSEHVPGLPPKTPEQAVFQQNNPSPEPPVSSPEEIQAMQLEYHFTLPLQLRRTEVITEVAKIGHLSARTRFWKFLSFSVVITPILVFVAILVK